LIGKKPGPSVPKVTKKALVGIEFAREKSRDRILKHIQKGTCRGNKKILPKKLNQKMSIKQTIMQPYCGDSRLENCQIRDSYYESIH
jgi:hypothetical protein